MKKFLTTVAFAAAALVASASAHAGVLRTTINFDAVDTTPLMYQDSGALGHGDEFYQDGLGGRTMYFDAFSNAAGAQTGDLVGALLNGACADLLCPANNPTGYLGLLDDAVLAFGSTDGFRFSVKSLNASFIGSGDPLQITPGFVRLQGVRNGVSTTATFALTGLDGNGLLNFGTINTGAFGNLEFDFVYAFAFACAAPGGGSTCSAFSTNRAQFALDDITIEHVPEPASVALVLAAGLAAGVSRRRAR